MSAQNGADEEPQEYFEDVIEEAAMFSAMGFGLGLLEQVLFDVASGTLPASTTPTTMMAGPFVVLMTVLGFAIGFVRGRRKSRRR